MNKDIFNVAPILQKKLFLAILKIGVLRFCVWAGLGLGLV